MRCKMKNKEGITMKKNNEKSSERNSVDFKEQTPKMQIEHVENSVLYEKAFLSSEPETENEYKRNTTSWD